MTTTVTKTKTAQPMGTYTPTAIDARKAAVDFRLIAITGRRYSIAWRAGIKADGIVNEMVTERQLKALQASNTWTTDF